MQTCTKCRMTRLATRLLEGDIPDFGDDPVDATPPESEKYIWAGGEGHVFVVQYSNGPLSGTILVNSGNGGGAEAVKLARQAMYDPDFNHTPPRRWRGPPGWRWKAEELDPRDLDNSTVLGCHPLDIMGEDDLDAVKKPGSSVWLEEGT
jgi:hypothetical protein